VRPTTLHRDRLTLASCSSNFGSGTILHGTMEYDVRCWDDPGGRRSMGSCRFHLRSCDDRNRLPSDPTYAIATRRWALSAVAQVLFVRALPWG
jgi:hypothetical protein